MSTTTPYRLLVTARKHEAYARSLRRVAERLLVKPAPAIDKPAPVIPRDKHRFSSRPLRYAGRNWSRAWLKRYASPELRDEVTRNGVSA